MKPKLFNLIKFFVGWPISVVSLIFILKILFPGASQINLYLNRINPLTLAPSILCFFTYFLLRGYIWQNILSKQKQKINLKKSLFLWSFSEFKRYVPGNIWSFVGRVVAFSNLGIDKLLITKSLMYEIEYFLLGCLIASIFALPIIFKILPVSHYYEVQVGSIFIFLTLFIVFFFLFSSRLKKKYKFIPDFKSSDHLKLITVSFISVFFFGLGTYFSAMSIFYINPKDIILFSGFFGFALLIGYLSLITPTGLGVREGILILGLSTVLPIQISAFISIFSRILLILSEIILLIFLWIWNNLKNSLTTKTESFIYKNWQGILVFILIIIYLFYFISAAFLRHDNFYTGRFDLGNMDQTIWNTIHGRIFQITDPNGTNVMSRLAFHADFILVLLSPLYFFWREPKMLLFIQTVVLSLGAIFVYLIAREKTQNKNLSLALSFCYLIYPPLNYINLFDFHPVSFAITLFLGAFYFTLKKKYLWVFVFLILAGLTKEEAWIQVGLFGIYLLIFEKRKLLGSLIFLLSSATFFYLVFYEMPKLAGGKHFALSYYSDFGESPSAILKNVILNPLKTLSVLILPDRLEYILKVLLPLAFLPIFSVYFVFTIPQFLINLLSSNIQTHEIFFQYTSTITPFLFISTIYAANKMNKYFRKLNTTFFIFLVLIFSLSSAYAYGPLPGSFSPNISMFTDKVQNNGAITKFLKEIPKPYSISATNNLGAHLSHREKIYTVPVGLSNADFVLFLTRGSEIYDPEIKKEKEFMNEVQKNSNYKEVYQNGDFIAFERIDLNFRFKE